MSEQKGICVELEPPIIRMGRESCPTRALFHTYVYTPPSQSTQRTSEIWQGGVILSNANKTSLNKQWVSSSESSQKDA